MNRPNPATITVAILAGGLGTRLRSAVPDRPKVLAQVNGRPFLAYLLDQVSDAGFEEVVLCTGYRAEAVSAEFGSSYRNLSLRYSPEAQPLGTGGALRQALALVDTNTVLALNGDSFVDANLRAFCARHFQTRALASLFLVWAIDPGRFGRVALSEDGSILSFLEKQANAPAGWINAGVYLVQRELLATIPSDCPISLERDCFPLWLESLCGVMARTAFLDIGTPESYRQAEQFFNACERNAKREARPVAVS